MVLAAGASLLALLLCGSAPAEAQRDEPGLRRQVPRSAHRLSLRIRLREGLDRFEVEQRSEHDGAVRPGAREALLQVHAAASAGEALELHLRSARCEPVPCEAELRDPAWGLVALRFARPWPRGEALRLQARFEGRLPALPEPPRAPAGGDPLGMLQGLLALAAGGSGGPPGHGLVGRDEAVASLPWAHLLPVAGEPVRGPRLGDLGPGEPLDVVARIEVPEGARVVATGLERPEPDGRGVQVVARGVRGFALLASRRWRTRCEQPRRLRRGRGPEPVRVCVWTARMDEQQAALMLQTAQSALALFEARFGRYPWDHLDVVEQRLSGGAGGVEHSGLVTVAPPPLGGGGGGLLATFLEAMLRFVTVHEVAHQWWFALVGSDARSEPVLDEALAQWSSLLYFREVGGEAAYERERERMVLSGWWMYRLGGGADAPALRPVADFGAMEPYAAIVYGKAPMLFEALERGPLGRRGLRRRLRRYAERHAFGRADVAALQGALTEGLAAAKARRVRELLRRWWREAHGEQDLGPATMDRLLAPWLQEAMGGGRRGAGPVEVAPPGRRRGRGRRRVRIPRDRRGLPDTNRMLREALRSLQGL